MDFFGATIAAASVRVRTTVIPDTRSTSPTQVGMRRRTRRMSSNLGLDGVSTVRAACTVKSARLTVIPVVECNPTTVEAFSGNSHRWQFNSRFVSSSDALTPSVDHDLTFVEPTDRGISFKSFYSFRSIDLGIYLLSFLRAI